MLRTLVFSTCVVLLCCWLYTPLPDDYEQPWRTRMLMAIFKLDGALYSFTRSFCDILNWKLPNQYEFILLSLTQPRCNYGDKVVQSSFDGVDVTLYKPSDRPAKSKAVVFYHGGGWVWEDEGYYSCFLWEIAQRTSSLVVSVRYRLAPTHVFPAGLDDCVRATEHFINNAAKYNVDSRKVVVAGDSAGGHMAAVVSQILRDAEFPIPPAGQMLLNPVLQAYDFLLPSYQVFASIPSLPTQSMVSYWLLYLKGNVSEKDVDDLMHDRHKPADISTAAKNAKKCDLHLIRDEFALRNTDKPVIGKGITEFESLYADPRMSPLLADDLQGLPKTLLVTSELDVLRDEGLMYVTRLRAAHNDVIHKHYDSAFHAFFTYFHVIHVASQALEDVTGFVESV